MEHGLILDSIVRAETALPGLAELWELVKTAGPFSTALVLYLLWAERQRSDALLNKYTSLLETNKQEAEAKTKSITEALNASTQMGTAIGAAIDRVKEALNTIIALALPAKDHK